MSTKNCTGCGETKPLTEFHKRARSKDGLAYRCRQCAHTQAVSQERRATTAKWVQSPKGRAARTKYWSSRHGQEARRNRQRRRLYGIGEAEFLAREAAQGGRCAICQQIPTSVLHVDHDHDTGKIRGLLCGRCNSGIGLLQDCPTIIESAAAYVRLAAYKGGQGRDQ